MEPGISVASPPAMGMHLPFASSRRPARLKEFQSEHLDGMGTIELDRGGTATRLS